jgi:3-hydroxyacyl-[acyl-carrier-protein] dehydratase
MNMEPIIQGDDLLKYIPQRAPFVMVDKLYVAEDNSIISGLSISDKNILTEDSFFQESGLIENMAQTCALYAGYKANELGKDAPVGFIAGIKNVVIDKLPSVGEDINTKIEIVNELMNMQIAMASVHDLNGAQIASCELRIFIKEED